MRWSIGFVLITHQMPEQVFALVNRLSDLYKSPPIACHHDFSQCDLNRSRFPSNVRFVDPHLTTRWAGFALVDATIRGIDLLYSNGTGPDWFVVLSGADYPVKAPARVLEDLVSSGCDVHMTCTLIDRDRLTRHWEYMCFRRYCSVPVRIPKWFRKLFSTAPELRLSNPVITRVLTPFSKTYRCYAGSQWFSANRDAAMRILKPSVRDGALKRHYQKVDFSDESYFQTVLGNEKSIRISNRNWRFTDMAPGAAHPNILGSGHLNAILASGAHFARKLDVGLDPSLIPLIDRHVDHG